MEAKGNPEFKTYDGSFACTLDDQRLARLITDALAGYRVYELLNLQRPLDVFPYLAARLDTPPSELSDSLGWREGMEKITLQALRVAIDRQFDSEHEMIILAWDDFLSSAAFRDYVGALLLTIQGAQSNIRNSADPLIIYEVELYDDHAHPYDWEPYRDATEAGEKIGSPVDTEVRAPFIQALQDLVRRPDVRSVSFRGPAYYPLMRVLCREQLRRAKHLAKHPRQAFPVGGLAPSEYCHLAEQRIPWLSGVVFYWEGFPDADLHVEYSQSGIGMPIKELVEVHQRAQSLYILLGWPLEESIDGYRWEVRDGLSVGARLL